MLELEKGVTYFEGNDLLLKGCSVLDHDVLNNLEKIVVMGTILAYMYSMVPLDKSCDES